jgi:hypothetical protein
MGVTGLALIGAALLFGEKGLDKIKGDEDSAGAPVQLAAAAEFDPDGDDRETGTQDLALDGDAETTWDTEHYDTEDFGGLKDGVGLVVEPQEVPEAVSALDIRSPNSGWDAEVYTVQGEPPDDLGGWGAPVGTLTGGGTRERIELEGEPGAAYLIWITKPPPSEEQEGRFQMQVGEVRLLG